MKGLGKFAAGIAALAAFALGGAAIAASGTTAKAKTKTVTTAAARTPETPLTGDVLAKVKAAAVAKVGGTVDAATTENDSSNAAAVYEAHVTKADGSRVTVILDKDYTVLAVKTGGPGGHGYHGHGGFGGPRGHGETALTGAVLTSAKAAATAALPGATIEAATTENDSSNTAAKYEVHATKADGTHVEVILDADFNVLSIEAHARH